MERSTFLDNGKPEQITKIQAENAKLRELLKSAVEDMKKIANKSVSRCTLCFKPKYREICTCCDFHWRHAREAEEVLKKNENP